MDQQTGDGAPVERGDLKPVHDHLATLGLNGAAVVVEALVQGGYEKIRVRVDVPGWREVAEAVPLCIFSGAATLSGREAAEIQARDLALLRLARAVDVYRGVAGAADQPPHRDPGAACRWDLTPDRGRLYQLGLPATAVRAEVLVHRVAGLRWIEVLVYFEDGSIRQAWRLGAGGGRAEHPAKSEELEIVEAGVARIRRGCADGPPTPANPASPASPASPANPAHPAHPRKEEPDAR